MLTFTPNKEGGHQRDLGREMMDSDIMFLKDQSYSCVQN
jgi:hypothetical protein